MASTIGGGVVGLDGMEIQPWVSHKKWAVRKLVLQLYVVIERKNLLKLVSSKSLNAPPATTEALAISLEVLQQQLAQEIQTKKIIVEGDSKVCSNGFVKEAEN
nr:hypothetical protein CFP56_49748 [Quercus suber]